MASVIERAIKQAGGLGALAKAFGISPQAVHKWIGAGVPPERVVELEKLSGVPREELIPDLYRCNSRPSTVASRKRA